MALSFSSLIRSVGYWRSSIIYSLVIGNNETKILGDDFLGRGCGACQTEYRIMYMVLRNNNELLYLMELQSFQD